MSHQFLMWIINAQLQAIVDNPSGEGDDCHLLIVFEQIFSEDYLQLSVSETKTAGQTLSDGAFEQIQNAIVKGQIAPGARISEQ
ncbi:MAG: hypothetical protein Q8L06_13875, partial [Pseudohongiella sp.]|nr:hypothetical protein [Pseudohongiella sp.]